ncbi:thioredoxin [Candidatus Woesearchaeota archaeon]|nr:thioredoxin [Candidatus Woesearchaeota archaeon]MBW3005638.1 thioredoxin [Candidatus Woesearchaeota archaeon]
MELYDNNFDEEVFKSDIPVLVELWASWCPPCKMMEPVMNSLEKQYEGKVKVCKINIDKNPKTSDKFDIKGVPTFLLVKAGEVIERVVAAKTEEQLKEMINKVL